MSRLDLRTVHYGRSIADTVEPGGPEPGPICLLLPHDLRARLRRPRRESCAPDDTPTADLARDQDMAIRPCERDATFPARPSETVSLRLRLDTVQTEKLIGVSCTCSQATRRGTSSSRSLRSCAFYSCFLPSNLLIRSLQNCGTLRLPRAQHRSAGSDEPGRVGDVLRWAVTES